MRRACVGLVFAGILCPSVSLGSQLFGQRAILDGSLAERWLSAMSIANTSAGPPKGRMIFYAPVGPDNDVSTQTAVATYGQLIDQIAASHGVDSGLVKAVVQAESAFNPSAVSRQGASGLMQLMPGTAVRYGVYSLLDPTENIRGGVRHLKYLLELFEHNTALAIAAYNAGENAVRRYQGIPPYGETQAYVKKVLRLQRTYSE